MTHSEKLRQSILRTFCEEKFANEPKTKPVETGKDIVDFFILPNVGRRARGSRSVIGRHA